MEKHIKKILAPREKHDFLTDVYYKLIQINTNEYKCVTLNTHIFDNFFISRPNQKLVKPIDFFVNN